MVKICLSVCLTSTVDGKECHALVSTPRKSLRQRLDRRLGTAQSQSGHRGAIQKTLALIEINT
jgi:hypothetical protein